MLDAITTALTQVITWIGSVLTAVVSSTGALKDLLPVLAVSIGIALVMLTVKIIKRFAWGA